MNEVLICGDRDWADGFPIQVILCGLALGSVVIEGDARGADRMAGKYGDLLGYEVLSFRANWAEHGKAAGVIRNQQMLDEGKPDIVFAFHDNLAGSKGTADMVRRARKAGIPVYIVSRPT